MRTISVDMANKGLNKRQVDQALSELDQLCIEEYGYGIGALMAEDDRELGALRLQRLTGILLKRPFAEAHVVVGLSRLSVQP